MIFWALGIENRARLTHFLAQRMAIFGKYLSICGYNEDEIFANMRIICMNSIFWHPHGHP